MIQASTPALKRVALALAVAISAGVFAIAPAAAQNQQMEEKLMAIKNASAANKQKLAQYTWTETEAISIKGEVKDTKTYQVQMVNGQQQKTLVNNQAASSGGGREAVSKSMWSTRRNRNTRNTGSRSALWPSNTLLRIQKP